MMTFIFQYNLIMDFISAVILILIVLFSSNKPPTQRTRNRKWVGNSGLGWEIGVDMAWKFPTHFLFFLLISKFSFATNIFNFPTHFPQFFTKYNVYLQPTEQDRFCSQSLAPFHTIYYALLFESIYICLTVIKKPVIICKIHRFFLI
jgi:hypothetical protein